MRDGQINATLGEHLDDRLRTEIRALRAEKKRGEIVHRVVTDEKGRMTTVTYSRPCDKSDGI